MKNKYLGLCLSFCFLFLCTVFSLVSFDVISLPEVRAGNSTQNNASVLQTAFLDDTTALLNNVNEMTAVTDYKIKPAVFGTKYIAALESESFADIYEFTVTERGTVSYCIDHPSTGEAGGWYARLYVEYYVNGISGETAYRLINTLETNSMNTTDSSVNIGVMPGKYRIVVSASDVFTSSVYKLTASFAERTDYEIECNDTPTRYTEIFSDVPMYGTASYFSDGTKTDTDCYMLRVDYPSSINIVFEHAARDLVWVAWRVTLTDINGNEIYSKTSLFTDEKIESGAIGLDEGVYFINVVTHVYFDTEYTLTVTKNSTNTFETEPNDTPENADSIDFSSAVSGTSSGRSAQIDRDWFKFTTPANGFVKLNFAHAISDEENTYETWRMSLYNEKMNLLCSKNIIANVENEITPSLGLPAGTYYVLIDNENMYKSSDTYNLTVDYSKSQKWEREPNNSSKNANVLTQGQPLDATLVEIGTDYDSDYFEINLSEKQDIVVSLSHGVKKGSLEAFVFTLYDKNMKPVAPVDENGKYSYTVFDEIIYNVSNTLDTAESKGYYNNLPAGKYYVKVNPGIYYSNLKYSIKYDLK